MKNCPMGFQSCAEDDPCIAPNWCIDKLPEGPALNVRREVVPSDCCGLPGECVRTCIHRSAYQLKVAIARAGLDNPQTVESCDIFPKMIKSDEQIAKDAAKISKQRKDTPVYSGVLAYFPLALAEIAKLSKAGNDKHNPGQPLHWSKDKSNDHADCIARHLLELGTVDPDDGFLHDVKLAWRALANLQIRLEGKS